ncbi:hypothetical protein L596_007672 [Steinernema carpocapsae]|uniref:Uncharacterized protein n=1 Tax=Steinernema carpocapsae TaxID=34508 RepID=A0A4U5PA53_STECR|nr:hypothetical protein L596_007672 [Steinernema carpocapsae]
MLPIPTLSTFTAAASLGIFAVGVGANTTISTTPNATSRTCTESAVSAHIFVSLVGISLLSLVFLVSIILSLITYVTTISQKAREAETNLHQVMDAILCNSIPKSVVNEIALIAEEAQKKKN